jgi:hypothetical protein
MIVKAALLFLVAALALGVLGRWTRRGSPRKGARGRIEPARKCPGCGAYVLGSRPEPCARPDCPMH